MIDTMIALIRGAADVEAARAGLMKKPFGFTEIQANFILDMQLRRLTQLEGQKLRDELAELQATIKELESILKSKAKLRTVIKDELLDLKKRYADERRTRLAADVGEIDMLDLIDDEEVVVVLSQQGLHQDGRGRRLPAPEPWRARVCGGAVHATTTTSTSCSRPPRTRTCCCSRTEARSTASARTRSR